MCFAAKLVPLAFSIHKLQISCVVEDDKVSVDWLQETLEEIEDYVSILYNSVADEFYLATRCISMEYKSDISETHADY